MEVASPRQDALIFRDGGCCIFFPFGTSRDLSMRDDGAEGDAKAGDGIYTGYGAHAAAGGFAHFSFPVSVHQNGQFFGLYDLIEQGDTEFLERVGLDPDGAFYKINNRLDSTTNEVEKLSRKYEGREDLGELVAAARMSNSTGLVWDYDNVDLADMINYLAAMRDSLSVSKTSQTTAEYNRWRSSGRGITVAFHGPSATVLRRNIIHSRN